MAKPIGPICNLDCTYCFYLEKEQLYPESKSFRMSDEVLETFVKNYIESQPIGMREIHFAWQGGEPTLLGVPFFEKAVAFQKRYTPPGKTIQNAFQTNAVLIDENWCEFFKRENFLIGVSIDGPEEMHDTFRVDKKAAPTFSKVMRGLQFLQRYGVEYNTLTVVNSVNSTQPARVYNFLKEIGSTYLQFIPLVHQGLKGELSPESVSANAWGEFLVRIFELWRKQDIGKIFIQHFDTMVGIAAGIGSSICVHSETCGRALAIEHNGDLYSCDHFVYPSDKLGNILKSDFPSMTESLQQKTFGTNKRDKLPQMCKQCDYLNYCWGGCPAQRKARTPEGEEGLNQLCAGYLKFYQKTVPTFTAMANAVNNGYLALDYEKFMQPNSNLSKKQSK